MNISNFALVAALSLTTIALAQEKRIERKDSSSCRRKNSRGRESGRDNQRLLPGKRKRPDQLRSRNSQSMAIAKTFLSSANGDVIEVEEQVALDSLPAAVRDGIQAKAGAGKIVKVESLTKHDKLVAYEAVVQTAGKKKEIQVDPNGRPLAHEE